jgi:RNA polymerase primary sigma factor
MAYRKFDTCFFERYSQLTLQTILGEKYASLVNKDRPDLQMEDGSLGIEVTRAMEPDRHNANQLLKEQLAEIISTLSEREQKIIKLRFGIGGGRPHTLEEVGAEFSVTRERIRQIEAKALSKLRKHKDTKKLHEYLR